MAKHIPPRPLFRKDSMAYPKTTHCKNGHERTEENTYIPPSGGKRMCRLCRRSRVKESYDRNRERVRERVRARRLVRPDCTPEQRRRKNLNYIGWTPELFDKVFEEQDHKCAICGKELNLEKKQNDARACADHEHVSPPKPRGILCTNCNLGVGNLQDSSEIIEKALAYVRRYEHGAPVNRIRHSFS